MLMAFLLAVPRPEICLHLCGLYKQSNALIPPPQLEYTLSFKPASTNTDQVDESYLPTNKLKKHYKAQRKTLCSSG